ncbi:MAG TPA: methyltransferase domain-containing protein, partial [Candidatus Acidoferrum sp.]|nr:methyltransferase domain-containing protein [Candidatus Acidoferrum sp.]
GSFDAVVTRLTLHHFPDPRRALEEMVRVMRPLGRIIVADVVSSEDAEDAALHNALETLRDPSHARMLSSSQLRSVVEAGGLRVTATTSWEMPREFEEWVRITNAPERRVPLWAIMRRLAQEGIQAGIDLRISGDAVVFKHRWLLITAEKAR